MMIMDEQWIIGSLLDTIRSYWIHDDFQGFWQRLRQADASTDQGTVQRLSSQRPESRLRTKRWKGKPWLMILSSILAV
jgi:hypothetical protein